jgi:hypothetical protein
MAKRAVLAQISLTAVPLGSAFWCQALTKLPAESMGDGCR